MKKHIPISIFCFLVSLGVLFGGILPILRELNTLNLEIERKNLEIAYKEEYFSDLKKLAETLEKHQESLAKINDALPREFSLPIFFNYLQSMSSESGLILKDMKIVGTSFLEEKSNIQERSFSLALLGSYNGLKTLLSNLEKSARLIETESIIFSSPSKEEEIFDFDLKINIHNYAKP